MNNDKEQELTYGDLEEHIATHLEQGTHIPKEDIEAAVRMIMISVRQEVKCKSTPKTLPNTKWQESFEKEFRKHYEGILSEEVIKKSILWNIDFMSPYMSQESSQTLPNVKWPEKKEEKIEECKKVVGEAQPTQLVPSHLEPPDYETPLNRAFLINKIDEWYEQKFKGQSGYKKVSIFDLIADFIIDTKYGTPALPSVEEIAKSMCSYLLKEGYTYDGDFSRLIKKFPGLIDHLAIVVYDRLKGERKDNEL